MEKVVIRASFQVPESHVTENEFTSSAVVQFCSKTALKDSFLTLLRLKVHEGSQ